MRALFALLITSVFAISCSNNSPSNGKAYSGEELYNNRCAACHGTDGNAGISGARDLSKSTLDDNMARVVILHGKGSMPPFKTVLSPEEVELIIKHIDKLKK
jgi:mono/diheme cytochrome c family protein